MNRANEASVLEAFEGGTKRQTQMSWAKMTKTDTIRGAAIAQWNRLRLPSCHPGFKSQACHLRFFIYSICAIFVM